MPRLQLDARFDASPEAVYEQARDFGAYRQWMKDIHSVSVVESGPGWQITEWNVVRLGQLYAWRERDEFDDAGRTIRSRLLESRFLDHFELELRAEADGDGTRLSAAVTFRVRYAAQVVEMLAAPLIRRNFTALTEALRARLQAVG